MKEVCSSKSSFVVVLSTWEGPRVNFSACIENSKKMMGTVSLTIFQCHPLLLFPLPSFHPFFGSHTGSEVSVPDPANTLQVFAFMLEPYRIPGDDREPELLDLLIFVLRLMRSGLEQMTPRIDVPGHPDRGRSTPMCRQPFSVTCMGVYMVYHQHPPDVAHRPPDSFGGTGVGRLVHGLPWRVPSVTDYAPLQPQDFYSIPQSSSEPVPLCTPLSTEDVSPRADEESEDHDMSSAAWLF